MPEGAQLVIYELLYGADMSLEEAFGTLIVVWVVALGIMAWDDERTDP